MCAPGAKWNTSANQLSVPMSCGCCYAETQARKRCMQLFSGVPPAPKSTGHGDTPRGRLSPEKSVKETADESTCLMFLGSNWVLGVTSLWHVFFFEPSASLLFYLLWRNKWKNKQDCINCLSSKGSSSSNDTCTAYCVKNRSTHCALHVIYWVGQEVTALILVRRKQGQREDEWVAKGPATRNSGPVRNNQGDLFPKNRPQINHKQYTLVRNWPFTLNHLIV